ncbi:MAG: translation initiation factor IF-2 N-terminal domain-containing protein [Phycisphaerae bacterium]|nr:translation initiation factor IF-2 N-terminal domain-containing protein [Phycisphaerae bacterium]
MAKKGINVKDLAKELGITSRDIVSRCRAEGFPVQNSITRLTPEVERNVRAWFPPIGTPKKPITDIA